MNRSLCQHYRCPEHYALFALTGPVSKEFGYFKVGEEVLYGRVHGGGAANSADHQLRDVLSECIDDAGTVYLPFDATEVVNDLRYEAYASSSAGWHPATSPTGRAYYFIRPLLPVWLRRHLQKIRLNGWRHLNFPAWPVDFTVDNVLKRLLLSSLQAQKLE